MTRTVAKAIHSDITEALKEIAAKYGLESTGSKVTWTDSDFKVSAKFNILDPSTGSKQITSTMAHQAKILLINAGMEEVPETVIGKEVYIRGIGFSKIVDVKPNRPKYPFVVECPKGRYKVSAMDVKDGFDRVVA